MTNIIKLPVKEKELKWWDVDCVLIHQQKENVSFKKFIKIIVITFLPRTFF